jgi:TolB-like protein/tetratricopeptide (TPR) repeat protein
MVFLSYASQDAEAAQRICEALRAAGIEVFLDQSELRGGDAWDQKIRHEIHDCALFIPIVSQHTQERLEGYFRHEWNLAIERTHHMAQQKPFLVPVVVDGTRDQAALVPDAFKAVQWTRLPGGETPAAFVERIKRLLSPELSPGLSPMSAVSDAPAAVREPVRVSRRSTPVLLAAVALLLCSALAYFLANKLWIANHATPETAARAGAAPTAFAPPPHSIAVLPFVNLSGDKQQEYFSDGLTEELLNSLSRINELQVAARTSSFSFQGEHPDIATVAHKLNVGAVLEGSVRRSANTVRVTTQLVNGITGFHVWSETYDRDLGDVLKLQTEIATAVAGALKVTLLGDEAAKVEVGGTRTPAAFDAYLRASKVFFNGNGGKDNEAAIARYTEAINLDPNYALAYAARALAAANFAEYFATTTSAVRAALDSAQADARKSIALAPNLGEGHLALARVFEDLLEFTPAFEEYERALTLAPGTARVLWTYGDFAIFMGRSSSGLTALRRAVSLDPLNSASHGQLGVGLLYLRRYAEAIAVFKDGQALDPDPRKAATASSWLGYAYYLNGDLESARDYCESRADLDDGQFCLAVTYDKLGRHPDAERMLAKARGSYGETAAVWYAWTYAQWGDTPQALDWLETAMRLRDGDLRQLKSPLLDPLRKEPRFRAIERELKFPD